MTTIVPVSPETSEIKPLPINSKARGNHPNAKERPSLASDLASRKNSILSVLSNNAVLKVLPLSAQVQALSVHAADDLKTLLGVSDYVFETFQLTLAVALLGSIPAAITAWLTIEHARCMRSPSADRGELDLRWTLHRKRYTPRQKNEKIMKSECRREMQKEMKLKKNEGEIRRDESATE